MPKKVLLVDDDREFRTVAALVLETAGYAVVQAHDGFVALELLGAERPDLIISDLNMPLMDGRALCKRVRADAEFSSTPFVILSAAFEEDGALADTPADYCFSKQSGFTGILPQLLALLSRQR
jgi:two-component system chemotaxis response regulator CheY